MSENETSAKNRNKKTSIIEKSWLFYYNDYLLNNGCISDIEHKKMTTMILARARASEKKIKNRL